MLWSFLLEIFVLRTPAFRKKKLTLYVRVTNINSISRQIACLSAIAWPLKLTVPPLLCWVPSPIQSHFHWLNCIAFPGWLYCTFLIYLSQKILRHHRLDNWTFFSIIFFLHLLPFDSSPVWVYIFWNQGKQCGSVFKSSCSTVRLPGHILTLLN